MRRFFFRSTDLILSKKLLSNLYSLCSLNYLYGVMVASVLAAIFVAAFFAAAHCTQCNSSDKKHFLHVFKKFLMLIKLYFFIYFSLLNEKRCKSTIFFAHIQKKL